MSSSDRRPATAASGALDADSRRDWLGGLPWKLLALGIAVAAAVLAFDLSQPLGVAGGVPYVALVLLGIWCPKREQVFILAALGSALTIAGYFLSPAGGIEWVVLTNRGLALFAIWITAFLIASRKQSAVIPWSLLVLTIVIITVSILAFDLSLPLGVAGGVPYVALVLLGIWCPKREQVFILAALGSALTIAGYFLSSAGGIEWVVLTNRGLALFAIWITAFLIDNLRQKEVDLGEREELFSLMAETIPSVFWICTPEIDRMLYASPAYEKIWGRSREELYKSPKSFIDPIHPEDKPEVLQKLAGPAAKGWDLEYRIQRPDGTTRWIEDRGFPAFDDDGKVVSMAGLAQDITDHKRAEEAAFEAKQDAELANRAKSDFLANMSHELRTPLNAIIGYSEALEGGIFGPIANEKQSGYLDIIHSSGIHLLSIINDILDLSAIESGKVELRETEFGLDTVAAYSTRILQTRAVKKAVHLSNKVKANLPKIRADELHIKQVLVNILSNAVKFTPVGGKVTLEAQFEADGSLAVSVTDTGIGMDKGGLAKAMEKFVRLENEMTTDEPGTGLGLPLVKELMELHGGAWKSKARREKARLLKCAFPKSGSCNSR